ncbi:hypothetical protein KIW84_034164 [Lathyrus oleraceus]|uniref:Gag-pro-like protein n=1 Tax=Pisum sativum TaxID=3888 RepID=A0A9D4XZM1_PEA|nr:hypothetical protein KIW84_034164 [Pisum sativum]
MVNAWHNVHMKGRSYLGPCNCVALEAYTIWVKKRTLELKMSYACERHMSMVVAEPSTLPNQDALNRGHVELQLESKDIDALIEVLEERAVKRQREPEDLFSSGFFRQVSYQFLFCVSAKLTHHYNTRANLQIRMEHLEQENRELKDEISRLTALMEFVIVAQNQPFLPPTTPPPQRTAISEISSSTAPVDVASQSIPAMPAEFPWGIPPNFVPEGYAPTFSTMPTSSRSCPDVYEKMDEMKDQFLELLKELKTLGGKDLFGKSASELCLVPNVKIPVKFKVPNFEKYKGNTYQLSHLVMYARKMSTQTDNDQLLIHYFQDSLTRAALKWYMGLGSASVRTFNDLGETFLNQYKYNVDMEPDKDQLRSMS